MSVQQRVRTISNNTNYSMDTEYLTAKIELTGICTLSCSFCYNSSMKETGERQDFMTDNDFKKALDFLSHYPSIKEVGLFYMGESGLHPKLKEYYQELKNRGYFTFLTTNGTVARYVLEAIPYIDSLKLSWNYKSLEDAIEKTGMSADIYNQIIDNAKLFYAKCHEYNKPFAVSTVLDSDKEEYSHIANILFPCDEHYFIPLQTQGGTINEGLGGVVGEADFARKQLPCWSLFRGIYIDQELNVRTCCYGHQDKHILGNLHDYDIKSKDEYKQLHLGHKIPDICKECLA